MSIWYPCIYCTEDLKCTKNSGDGAISFCVLGPCHDETPSNADRIRAMTDEKLANILSWLNDSKTADAWLEWLRQEAEDDAGSA